MVISVFRKEARQNLKGKWKKAILIMLLFYLITILIGTIVNWIAANTGYGLLAIIINIVITVALGYGLLVSFIKLKRNEKVNCLHFIYYAARDVEKVWKLIGRVIIKLSGYIILLMFFIYLVLTELVSLYNGYGMRISYVIEILGVIGFSILLTVKLLYYSFNNNILYEDTKIKAKDILKESERLMKNHRWNLFKMFFSFTGWFLLAIVFSIAISLFLFMICNLRSFYVIYIVYIPLIFLLPYILITMVCFYDYIKANNPKPKEEVQNIRKKKNKNK